MSTPPTFKQLGTSLYWDDGQVLMLDQRRLPAEEVWNRYTDHHQVAEAIQTMVIRGAPAIGCAAAMGLAAGAWALSRDPGAFTAGLDAICDELIAARPTAVNLAWAIERLRRVASATLAKGVEATLVALEHEALAVQREDVACCRAMGRIGAKLLPDEVTVLTHCNTGTLATGGYGTALGVIRAAVAAGKRVKVYADETRPFLQGARLTAWELSQEGIDVTVICDSMAGALMQQGAVDCVLVGSDRIARNGDVANKIGTYTVAVLAGAHEVPFYVAAPRSTIDLEVADGAQIPIEERPPREVTHMGQMQITPMGVPVRNIAFDVTPARLVTAIITEVGIARPPSEQTVAALFEL
jgi:methylthioribose-1-phosphate isomerase